MTAAAQSWSSVTVPLLGALAAADGPRLARELAAAAGVKRRSVDCALDRWVRAGLVTASPGKPKSYSMTSVPVPRRRRPTKRQRLWTAIRVLKRFDVPTLVMTAEVSRGTAEAYLNALCRGGFVRRTTRGVPARGVWAMYQIARRSGPLSPIVNNRRIDGRTIVLLVDRNDGRRVDISPGTTSLLGCIRRAAAPADDGGED